VLPVSMVPSLLKAVAENEKNRPSSVRLFEVGKAQFPCPEKRTDRDPGFDEVPLLAGVLAGRHNYQSLQNQNAQVSFADLKGLVAALAKRLQLPLEFRIGQTPESWLHPHRQALLCVGETVLGACGEVHPKVLGIFDINIPVYLFEIDLQKVLSSVSARPAFQMFSRQVPTTRDISIEIDERVSHAEVLKRIQALQAKFLVDTQLKDVYQGDKLAQGRKNFLYQLTYQAADRTLTDEEVNKIHDKLRERISQDGVIQLR